MKRVLTLCVFIVTVTAILGCGYQEGTVKYEDCREIIYLEKNSWQLYLHSFTCTYE